MNITLNNEKWYSYCDSQYEYVIQSLTWITPIYDNSICQAELLSGLTDDSRAKYENCTGSEPEAICIIPHCGNCFEPSEWRFSAPLVSKGPSYAACDWLMFKTWKISTFKGNKCWPIIDWWGENYKLSEKSLPSMICWSQLWVWAWVQTQTQTQTPSSHLCYVRLLEVNHNPSEYMQN